MARRFALLIGNTEFDSPEDFPKLHTPANDVQDFASSLMRHGRFEIVDKLINESAENLKLAIEDFYINRAKRGDLTLLYYSGHGFRNKSGKFYLAAKNTQFNHSWTTGIEDDFIRQVLKNSGSRHHIIILDCCSSGAFIEGRKSGAEPLLFEKLEGITTAILASSRASEYSFESEGRNSLFTYQLMYGIRTGEADRNNDGCISVNELFDYAERKVRAKYDTQSPIMNLTTSKSKVIVAWCPQVPERVEPLWRLPNIDEILDASKVEENGAELQHQKSIIEFTLAQLGIETEVRETHQGPNATQFSINPGNKARIKKIGNSVDALSMALKEEYLKIEEPSHNYPYIRIIIPSRSNPIVQLRRVIEASGFRQANGVLKIGLGLDTFGESVAVDLTTMPHLFIGGTTGSGKSVCLDAIIANLLCTQTPDDLGLILIGSEVNRLKKFNGIPHLLCPIINNVKAATKVFEWAKSEISQRLKKISKIKARDISSYNQKFVQNGKRKLPYIVVIIDGLSGLIPINPINDIVRTGHLAGIHLILTTSTGIVPRYVKKNISTRIAFTTATEADSRQILDIPDAAYLQGMGDMLYKAPNPTQLQRLQSVYVSDAELKRIIKFWKNLK